MSVLEAYSVDASDLAENILCAVSSSEKLDVKRDLRHLSPLQPCI